MEEYKANSHRSKTEVVNTEQPKEKKKVEKVVTGKVVKKKNPGRTFSDIFLSEDAQNVKSYILMDVLVPALKKAVSDVVTNGIDMLLYGESGGRSKRSSNVSYGSYYSGSSSRKDDRNYRDDNRYSRSRSGYSYDDIIFESRKEAEEVLSRMDELIELYSMVSVADMYDLAGISCEYTDNNYGWTNIRSAEVIRVRGDGFVIKLPKALVIK